MYQHRFATLSEACNFCQTNYVEAPPVGELIRVSTLSHPRKKNGFITTVKDGVYVVGNYENGLRALAANDNDYRHKKMSAKEKRKYNLKAQLDSVRRELANQESHAETATLIKTFFDYELGPYPTEELEYYGHPRHPYLVKKQVHPTGTIFETNKNHFEAVFGDRQYLPNGRLLVLAIGRNKRIKTLQFIDENGGKHYLKGGAKQGNYWTANRTPIDRGTPQKIHIAEGVATILSVMQNPETLAGLGYQIPSGLFFACMDSGNIPHVAESLRAKYLGTPIVVWADLDKPSQNNQFGAGIRSANDAKRNISNIEIEIPKFTNELIEKYRTRFRSNKNPSDFNDLLTLIGDEEC